MPPTSENRIRKGGITIKTRKRGRLKTIYCEVTPEEHRMLRMESASTGKSMVRILREGLLDPMAKRLRGEPNGNA